MAGEHERQSMAGWQIKTTTFFSRKSNMRDPTANVEARPNERLLGVFRGRIRQDSQLRCKVEASRSLASQYRSRVQANQLRSRQEVKKP